MYTVNTEPFMMTVSNYQFYVFNLQLANILTVIIKYSIWYFFLKFIIIYKLKY